MMRHLIGAALLMAGLAGAAVPQTRDATSGPVVVELFTSQGCSSCPPADALLHDLAERGDVLALSLHVDYWDYIGWKDQFAQPAFTLRQKAYAVSGDRKMIYTPQMIVAGHVDVVGHKAMKVVRAIEAARARPARASIAVEPDGAGGYAIDLTALDAGLGPQDVRVVRYDPSRKIEITHGENAGRDLTYTNVVTQMTEVGSWDGVGELRMMVDIAGPDRAAVIVQGRGQGPVVAAARLR